MSDVFRALGDPSRRRLLDSLNGRGGQSLSELCAGLDMTRQSVSKHLAVLEDANLVASVRRGRQRLHYLNAGPINDIAERWISQYHQERVVALSDLKRALEEAPVNRPEFAYVSYIQTTPEVLYRALTDPDFTRRYWGIEIESAWQPDSSMSWRKNGVTQSDPRQVVLDADPHRRLSYTWHAFSAEWNAQTGELDDERLAVVAAEPLSHVRFELEAQNALVKLTVVQDSFEPDSVVAEMVSRDWPIVISRLKSLLETGEAQPAVA